MRNGAFRRFTEILIYALGLGLSSAGSATADDQVIEELKSRLERLEKLNQEQRKEKAGEKKEGETGKNQKETGSDPKSGDMKEDEKKEEKKEEKKKEEKKKEEEKKPARSEVDYETYGIKSLWNSMTVEPSTKKWYEKLGIRGYTQVRFGRTVDRNDVTPQLLGDRSIDGATEDFSLRRVRIIFSGEVTEHLGIYIQPDFAVSPEGQTRNTFFTQLRDCYGDVFLTTDKVHRVRVGLSKVPYGFENLQSSQNRLLLDRTEAVNSAVNPNERDLGAFYYWTPEEYQQLLRDLVDGGLKGSGNYGIFGIGVYNGQGGSQFELNRNLHAVARLTLPYRMDNGQVVEASIQGYTGEYVVEGATIRPLGVGGARIPTGTRASSPPNRRGIREERVALTLVAYPQPFGFQAEWQVGSGPGLSPDQQRVEERHLSGGYVMAMYKYDSVRAGIFIPFVRYQQFEGGIRSSPNAPFGNYRITELGMEWQIWKGVELTCEYAFVNRPNTTAINTAGARSYRDFEGEVLRFQLQLNY